MDIENKIHLLIFTLCLGFFLFIANSIWSALFIISLPMDKDWCLDVIEIEVAEGKHEWKCIQFKNTLEELKYYHNNKMLKRNKLWLKVTYIFGSMIGLFTFYFLPKWRHKQIRNSESAIASLFLGAFIAFIVPLLFSWILPPPSKWFPKKLTQINYKKQELIIQDLKESEQFIESMRNNVLMNKK